MSESEGKASQSGRIGAPPAEDAESAWLRARRQDPGAPPPSAALVREHAQLETLLGNLSPMRVDDSWHEDVLKVAVRAHQRTTRRRWTATVIVGAAAVVSGIWLWPAHGAREPSLDVKISRPHGETRGGEAAIGDLLIVRARLEQDSDLRVYRDRATVLARCPNGAGCRGPGADTDQPLIELPLDLPGEYDVLHVTSAGTSLPDGPMDAYLAAARNANARIASHRVDVR